MTVFSAVLADGRLVEAWWDATAWEARVTRAAEHLGYRRARPLAAALAGAGAPPDVQLRAREQAGQMALL